MESKGRTRLRLVLAIVLAATTFAANAAGDGKAIVSTEGTYLATTSQGKSIIQWLEAVDAPRAAGLERAIGREGRYRVIHSIALPTTDERPRALAPGDGPPMPLPPSGSPGETITLERTAGRWFESCTYNWASDGAGGWWLLAAYRYERVRTGPMPD